MEKQERKKTALTYRCKTKTYLLKEFGANEFKQTAYFNFEGDERLKSVFEHDFNAAGSLLGVALSKSG